jgi:predicted Co/Zn/Cd cation transporter (cation efflux family)
MGGREVDRRYLPLASGTFVAAALIVAGLAFGSWRLVFIGIVGLVSMGLGLAIVRGNRRVIDALKRFDSATSAVGRRVQSWPLVVKIAVFVGLVIGITALSTAL